MKITGLVCIFRSQGVQWPLRENDSIRVETADGMVGLLSGEAIRHLIQHHLATAALQSYVAEELRKELMEETPVPLVILQRKGPVTAQQRAALRDARRSRRRQP